MILLGHARLTTANKPKSDVSDENERPICSWSVHCYLNRLGFMLLTVFTDRTKSFAYCITKDWH